MRCALVEREPTAAAGDVQVQVVSMGEVRVRRQDMMKGARPSEVTDQIAQKDAARVPVMDDGSGTAAPA